MDAVGLIRQLGADWRAPVTSRHAKFLDRPRQIRLKSAIVDRYLRDFRHGGCHCLDVSCGNGVLLEVLRHYGNTVVGAEREHFELLQAQDVPYVEFDGDRLPYPFEDRSFDLVTCIGSITFYEAPWPDVLAEFCRIARRTVFLAVNRGWVLDAHRALLDHWTAPGWRCVLRGTAHYKWVRDA